MQIFSSVTKLARDRQEQQGPVESRGITSSDNHLAMTLGQAGAMGIATAAAGAIYYSRKYKAGTLKAVEGLLDWTGIKPPSLSSTINKPGAFSGHPGVVQDLMRMGYNSTSIRKAGLTPFLEEMRNVRGSNLATVGDYLSELKSSNLNTDLSQVKFALNKLSTFRKDLGATGSLYDIPLGEGIIKRDGRIMDLNRYTPSGMFKRFLHASHEKARLPFTSFSPTDIFLHKAWAHESKFSVMPKGVKLDDLDIKESSVAYGNTIITDSGKVFRGGKDFKGNLRHIRENSSLSYSLHSIRGDLRFRSSNYLAGSNTYGFFNKAFLNLQASLRDKTLSPEVRQQVQDMLARNDVVGANKLLSDEGGLFENFLISPKFARERSVKSRVGEWFSRIADNAQAQLREGYSIDPNEGFFSRINRQIRIALKSDVEGYQYVNPDGSVHREHTLGPIRQFGKEVLASGAYDFGIEERVRAGARESMINTIQTVAQTDESFLTSQLGRSIAHYLTDRPNRIFEALTGFGVNPSSSVVGNLLRSTVGVSAVVGGAWEALKFADFATANVPSTLVGGAIGAAQVGVSAVSNVSGIQDVASTTEEYLPGSVNSFASQLARGIGLPFAGAILGEKIYGDKPVSSPEVLKGAMKYIGTDLAEKHATGRAVGTAIGMSLALASFITDPTQNLTEQIDEATGDRKVPIRASRWWFAGRQPFGGDRIEYYDYSLAQKIMNRDAIDRNIYGSEAAKYFSWLTYPFNPDFVEDRNADLRPYPVSGRWGENIPVVGPVVGATVGQALSTYTADHATIRPEGSPYGNYGPAGAAGALGFSDMQGATPDYDEVGSFNATSNAFVDNMQDYTGLFGFISKFPLRAFTGSDTGFEGGMQLASSSQITSPDRHFNDMNLGGLLGTTEWVRRMLSGDPNNVEYYNPLENTAPSWLPGTGSAFAGDQDFRIDFHRGDLYTKVKSGETRLPGGGYETMNELHGGDGYDFVDIYNILSDVASGSDAHKHYSQMMESYISSGMADQSAIDIYERAEEENIEKLKGKYNFTSYAGQSPITHASPSGDAAREYLSYVNVGIAETPTNPIMAPIQDVWDMATHFRVPGLAWAQGKFMHNRTPLEEYIQTQVHGTEMADWNKPYEAFIKPAANEVAGFALGDNFIPYEVQKRREIEEYYDKLEYLKARRLQQRAAATGDSQLAAQFKRQAQQTIVGLPYDQGGLDANIFQAVPGNLRSFVPAFARATPEEQEKIRGYLPSNVLPVFEQIWGVNTGGGNFGGKDSFARADQEVAEYFSSRAMPDSSSNIWNPQVSTDEYRLKTYENEGITYHTMGIPEAKAVEYRSLGRAEIVIDSSPFSDDMTTRNRILSELGRDPHVRPGAQVYTGSIRQNSTIHYNDPRRRQMYDNSGYGRF